jgi:hypothetical protein
MCAAAKPIRFACVSRRPRDDTVNTRRAHRATVNGCPRPTTNPPLCPHPA